MAKNPHTSFRLTGECKELLALLARLDGLNMTKEIEKLVRERVDRIGVERHPRQLEERGDDG